MVKLEDHSLLMWQYPLGSPLWVQTRKHTGPLVWPLSAAHSNHRVIFETWTDVTQSLKYCYGCLSGLQKGLMSFKFCKKDSRWQVAMQRKSENRRIVWFCTKVTKCPRSGTYLSNL